MDGPIYKTTVSERHPPPNSLAKQEHFLPPPSSVAVLAAGDGAQRNLAHFCTPPSLGPWLGYGRGQRVSSVTTSQVGQQHLRRKDAL